MEHCKPTIVAVDDSRSVGSYLMQEFMATGFNVYIYEHAVQALEGIVGHNPDLILLDIVMPDMDGFELCKKIKEIPAVADVPILFLSGSGYKENVITGFSLGAVDFIEKPIVFEVLLARVRTHLNLFRLQKFQHEENLRLEMLLTEKIDKLYLAQLGTITALARLAESRDTDTGSHLDRVQAYCELLARAVALLPDAPKEVDEWFIRLIKYSSSLHDIGKVSIPDAVLLKPGKLEPDEFECMKTHTSIGADTLLEILVAEPDNEFIKMGYEIARSHHEKWDGTGYPQGLKGDAIPLAARIMAIADVYDALRAERCYKKGFTHEKAYAIIEEGAGTHFDPKLVDLFIEHESQFNQIWNDYSLNQS